MNLLNIIGIGVICAVLCLVLREFNKSYAVVAACLGGVMIIMWGVLTLSPVVDYLYSLSAIESVSPYLGTAVKALSVGFITQVGAETCRDTGESSLAARVEFAGKAAILVVCLPSLKSILDMSLSIMS